MPAAKAAAAPTAPRAAFVCLFHHLVSVYLTFCFLRWVCRRLRIVITYISYTTWASGRLS
jgi:hypothetical protein